MAAKKKATNPNVDEMADGWSEIPSTASVRWWIPTEEPDTEITVSVEEKQDRTTRFGNRSFYMCRATKDCVDAKGDIERGLPVIIWESAGLRDLSRFVGNEVRIIPAGRVGRTRIYRFFTRGNRNDRGEQ